MFYNLIKPFLEEYQITLQDFSEMTNQTRQNVWKKFKTNATTEAQMKKFCDTLGLSVAITITDPRTGKTMYGTL